MKSDEVLLWFDTIAWKLSDERDKEMLDAARGLIRENQSLKDVIKALRVGSAAENQKDN